jgi:hypothetical protein
MLICDISATTSVIQAIATGVLVLLTLLTLVVLVRYAADTKRIAEVSIAQTENSQMPCLVVVMLEEGGSRGWAIENQGTGPALNIRFTGSDGGNQPIMKTIPPLAAKAHRFVHNDIAEVFTRWPQDFKINYESLSGMKYSTTLDMRGEMQTQFHRPPFMTAETTIGDFLRSF